MKKIIVFVLFAVMMMPVMGLPVFAEEAAQTAVTDAGNKICPISGSPVSGTTFVTYHGKRYGLCCPGCKEEFLKAPETYIAHLDEAKPAASNNMKM